MTPGPRAGRTGRAAHLCAAFLVAALAGAAVPARAEGDAAYGAYLAGQCVSCHRETGEASVGVPAIIGWPESHFVEVMNAYRSKARDSEVMGTIASALSEEEISALAAHFASLARTRGSTGR